MYEMAQKPEVRLQLQLKTNGQEVAEVALALAFGYG
jgi:hypothetical protein